MTQQELLDAFQSLDTESGLTIAQVIDVHFSALVSIVLSATEGDRAGAAADLLNMSTAAVLQILDPLVRKADGVGWHGT